MEGRSLTARDVVLVFTHDPKFDEPALIAALDSGAGYVGALGSRRTQERRVERLLEAGLEDALDRRGSMPRAGSTWAHAHRRRRRSRSSPRSSRCAPAARQSH